MTERQRPSFSIELRLDDEWTIRANGPDPATALGGIGGLLGVDVNEVFEEAAQRWRQQGPRGDTRGVESVGGELPGGGDDQDDVPVEPQAEVEVYHCSRCGTEITQELANLTMQLADKHLCGPCWNKE